MKQTKKAIGWAGFILIFFGGILGLLLIYAQQVSKLEELFAQVQTGLLPSQSLRVFECPTILDAREADFVHATVINSTGALQNYRVHIQAQGFTITGLPSVMTQTLHAGDVVSYTWMIQPKDMKDTGMDIVTSRAISVSALSLEDVTAFDPSTRSTASWARSYHQTCGVAVLHFHGITPGQIMWMSGVSLFCGLVLIIWWGYAKWVEWREGSER